MTLNKYACVRRYPSVLVITLCVMFFGAFQSASAQKFDSIERQRTLDMLKTVKASLKDNYYDPSLPRHGCRSSLQNGRGKAQAGEFAWPGPGNHCASVDGPQRFARLLHSTAPPETIEYGWEMQMIGDACFIVAVKPGSDAEKKGLKVGDLVSSVEGFKPTRKEMWKMNYYYRALSPRPGLQVVAQSPGAAPRELNLAAKVTPGDG